MYLFFFFRRFMICYYSVIYFVEISKFLFFGRQYCFFFLLVIYVKRYVLEYLSYKFVLQVHNIRSPCIFVGFFHLLIVYCFNRHYTLNNVCQIGRLKIFGGEFPSNYFRGNENSFKDQILFVVLFMCFY